MQYYTKWIFLSKPIGNNIFSYQERKKRWSDCQIYIPPMIYIHSDISDNLTLSDFVGFEEIDESWKLHSYNSLQNHLSTKNIYIIDNHNHALYRWYLWYSNSTIQKWSTLIHIDQHADMWIPKKLISQNIFDLNKDNQLEYIYNYVNTDCNVWNFITPAKNIWLVSEIIQVRSRYALWWLLQKIWIIKNQNMIILDIDCDFWSDEIDEESIDMVREIMKYADIITIATSPYFIDFEKAKKVINKLLW